ncbi:MAG: type 4a pilus biogenesis protein PilO [Thermoleophilia bacterium]|nr:type 4a pilus biogenesis protein PilO [Thermoleophilia bacterium]
MKTRVPVWVVAAVLLLVVAVAGYIFAIRPKRDELAKLDVELATAQAQIVAATRLAGTSEGEDAAAAIRVADLVRIAKAMPDALDMPGIILELNIAASEAGVEFTSIEPGSPAVANGYTTVPINLTFEGSYYELTELLFELRNLVTVRDGALDAGGRLFTIAAINLQEGTGGFPQIKAALTVSAYQYGVDPALLATAAAVEGEPATTETAGTTGTEPAPPTDTGAPPTVTVGGNGAAAEANGGTP